MEASVNGLLLWGLVLPILLVVAGTVVLIRKRNGRR
jgi:LPXTG-motif cell wall-anchored protein